MLRMYCVKSHLELLFTSACISCPDNIKDYDDNDRAHGTNDNYNGSLIAALQVKFSDLRTK